MRTEIRRQAVHLSGILIVILAQFIDSVYIVLYFLFVAIFFLIYSLHIKREKNILKGIVERLESQFREFTKRFERETDNPFIAPFWFYFAGALSFTLFKLDIASAAMGALAVGDSFSTIFGKAFGRKRILGKKTVTGTVAGFFGAVIGVYFFVPSMHLVLFASAVSALVELFSEKLERFHLDDNLLIPVFVGGILSLFLLF